MASSQASPNVEAPARRRVSAAVALALLEVMRSQDLPDEILHEEDVSITIPRRLGLSDVIDNQIRRYREEARKGARITDQDLRDLVGLVIRRPDADEVFMKAGARLAETEPSKRAAILPGSVSYALARRRVRKRIKALFGRRLGRFEPGPFLLGSSDPLLVWSDPGGDACSLVSGLCQAVLSAYLGRRLPVLHEGCMTRGAQRCTWRAVEAITERARRPEVAARMPDPAPEAG